MPEVKNAFIKSKMNKDLDARLLPSGEYRNAMNAQISKSEGSDVGTLQNILGNTEVADFASLTGVSDLKTIGSYVSDFNSTVYLFLTNNTPDPLDPDFKYYKEKDNFVVSYNTLRKSSHILVQGAFLNFSTDSFIYGINLLENILFWTDNRNQPRKINVNTATNNELYYLNEDQISVAKYNPYATMQLWRQRTSTETAPLDYETTMYDVFNKFYPTGGTALTDGAVVATAVFPIDTIVNDVLVGSAVTGEGVVAGTTVVSYNSPNIELSVAQTLDDNTELVFNANPYYEPDFNGDSDYLKDKFVRFAYRFQFDDGEYSIFSPFTQPAFIPKQDGYFMYKQSTSPAIDVNDEEDAYRSTIVEFMENKVNKVLLNIPLPFTKSSTALGYGNPFRITGVDILYKESDALAVKVLDSVDIKTIGSDQDGGGENNYVYNYQSKKPYKTLPSKDLIRVYDKTPVRAFSQEVISNRIVYGNYQDKHTPPKDIDYNLLISPKEEFNLNINTADVNGSIVDSSEFEVDNIQSGVYVGFQMTGVGVEPGTIIVGVNGNTVTVNKNQTLQDDTVLTFTPIGEDINNTSIIEYPNHSLKENRNYQVGVILSDRYGRSSTVILSSTLTSKIIGDFNFVGSTIYSPYRTTNDIDSSIWPGNSLKVLFNSIIGPPSPNYNTLEPGIYNGDAESDDYNPLGWYSYKIVVKQTEQDYYNVYLPGVMASYPNDTTLELGKTSFSVLINDNINKVPRDLTEVGPQQKQFRSSVRLFGRVENTLDFPQVSYVSNTQYYPGRTSSVVSTIADNDDLFNGDNATGYVPSSEFYQIESDPLIGKISTNKQFGVVAQIRQGSVDATTSDSPAVDIDNLLGVPVAGDLITGYGVTPGTSVISFADPVLTMSSDQTLLDNTVLTFTPQLGSNSIQHLAIFETEPVESLLDIFWETSTSGIVSELNNFITNDVGGSSTLGNWATNNWCESDNIGTKITDNPFFPIDNFGNPIDPSSIVSLELLSVFNSEDTPQNVQLSPAYFTLFDNLDGTYDVKTNVIFVNNSNYLELNRFNFNFRLTTVDDLGQTSVNEWSEFASVCNEFPEFGGGGGYAGEGLCPPVTDIINVTPDFGGSIKLFYGKNGSIEIASQVANGGIYSDITFANLRVYDITEPSTEIANAFVLQNITPWSSSNPSVPSSCEVFKLDTFTTQGTYVVSIDVVDGPGAITTCDFFVEITPPPCYKNSDFNDQSLSITYTKCDGTTGTVQWNGSPPYNREWCQINDAGKGFCS